MDEEEEKYADYSADELSDEDGEDTNRAEAMEFAEIDPQQEQHSEEFLAVKARAEQAEAERLQEEALEEVRLQAEAAATAAEISGLSIDRYVNRLREDRNKRIKIFTLLSASQKNNVDIFRRVWMCNLFQMDIEALYKALAAVDRRDDFASNDFSVLFNHSPLDLRDVLADNWMTSSGYEQIHTLGIHVANVPRKLYEETAALDRIEDVMYPHADAATENRRLHNDDEALLQYLDVLPRLPKLKAPHMLKPPIYGNETDLNDRDLEKRRKILVQYDRVRRIFAVQHRIQWFDFSAMPSVLCSQLMALRVDKLRRQYGPMEQAEALAKCRLLVALTYGHKNLVDSYVDLLDEASAFLRILFLLVKRTLPLEIVDVVRHSLEQPSTSNKSEDDAIARASMSLMEAEVPLGAREF